MNDRENPPHLESATQSLADLHAAHSENAPSIQLGIERITRRIGRPWTAYGILTFVVLWIGINLGMLLAGRRAFDPPQFFWLQGLVSLSSLLMATFILITENRQGDLAELRAQTTLQIALVSEQKIAKIIELLTKLREDEPHVEDRRDAVADAMSDPTDLRTAVSTLEVAQDEAVRKRVDSAQPSPPTRE